LQRSKPCRGAFPKKAQNALNAEATAFGKTVYAIRGKAQFNVGFAVTVASAFPSRRA